jgi:sulfate permease, SulP family
VQEVHDVVLVMSAVNQMDATAVEVLTELNRDLAEQHIVLHLAEVKGPIQDRLTRTPLWAGLSGGKFLSAHEAFVHLSAAQVTKK